MSVFSQAPRVALCTHPSPHERHLKLYLTEVFCVLCLESIHIHKEAQ